MSQPNNEIDLIDKLSLENCDKEPVHIPGYIQGFAALIATDSKLQNITHCSANAKDTFGKTPNEILGQPLSLLFNRGLLHDLNNTLCLSSAKFQRERVGEYVGKNGNFEVWAHLSDDLPIVEVEKVHSNTPNQSRSILEVRSLLTRLQQIDNLEKTLNDAAIGLRSFSGFDRVMVYQFDTNGDGEVKAEARSPKMSPFLGLRFPKWDIPNQARDIMKRVPLRMIADIHSRSENLIALDPKAPPLDLTYAACRGQSPIHTEYLGNMGVRSTMTLSIVVNDKLWGLFAFHSQEPHFIDPSMRGAAELFAQFFSLQMDQRLERTRNMARSISLSHEAALLDAADEAQNIGDLIEDIAEPFCKLLEADGLVMITGKGIVRHGLTPSPDTIKIIGEKLFSESRDSIASYDSLVDLDINDTVCAGALAMRVRDDSPDFVVFFRAEAALSVTWAGAPDKHIVEEEDGPRLKPRGSFSAYKQSIKNKCKPWEPHTLLSANEVRLALVKADATLFRRLSQKDERQRSIYIAELNHRVRNILALIRSISRRTHESSNSLETYARALEQRITALAAAHDLATNKITTGVEINAVFETEAKPYLSETQKQLFISGDSYLIREDAAPIFALVVHELMTNCVKYGAFSNSMGRVHINILRRKDMIEITWKEHDGPSIKKPSRQGFGLGLIEKAIPYELDGDSKVDFHPDGLSVTLWLPYKIVEPLSEAFAKQSDNIAPLKPKLEGIPSSVLVVEDSMMVALDTSDMLQKIGVQTVETCATVSQANSVIKSAYPDFAVLDISLRDTTSFAIAKTLQSAGIPFCFVTGFGSNMDIPEEFKNETVLTKPTDLATLRSTVLKLYRNIKT